jgi:hypothetical protein
MNKQDIMTEREQIAARTPVEVGWTQLGPIMRGWQPRMTRFYIADMTDPSALKVRFGFDIEVYHVDVAFGAPSAAKVNWGGIGSRSAAEATAFATLLGFAAAHAARLDAEWTAANPGKELR